MKWLRINWWAMPTLLLTILIAGCGFEDPYVPSSIGSSALKGYIVTDPATDISGVEVLLSGSDSFSSVTESNGEFQFDYITPGSYSIHIQKGPYIQESYTVSIDKDSDENIGALNVKLKGSISGTIPRNKIAILQGEVEIEVYVNGMLRVLQRNDTGNYSIDLSTPGSVITIRTVTKTTVYLDDVPYNAKVLDDGTIIVEFVPPGIYNDIKVKLNNTDDTLPLVTDGTVEVKSGQTRVL